MLGEPVRAPEAERIGLISKLTDEGSADEAAQMPARRLAEGPALAYAQTKALLTAELDMPLAAYWTLHTAAEQGYEGPGVSWPAPYRAGSRRPNTGRLDAPKPRLSLER